MSARTRALFFCFSLLTHACAGSEEPGAPIWSRLGANASGDGIAFAPDGDVILVGPLIFLFFLGYSLYLTEDILQRFPFFHSGSPCPIAEGKLILSQETFHHLPVIGTVDLAASGYPDSHLSGSSERSKY